MAESGSKGVDREVSQVTGHQMDPLYTSSIFRAGCSAGIPREEGHLCHLQRFMSTAHVSTTHYTWCRLVMERDTVNPRCSKTQPPGANRPLPHSLRSATQLSAEQLRRWHGMLFCSQNKQGYRGSEFGSDRGLLTRNPTLATKFSLRKVARGE